MKNILVSILLLFHFSCASWKKQCEHFFSYESKTVNVAGLKSRLKKNEKSHDVSFGDFQVVKVPIEVSERLKELDLMQYVFCQKIKELDKDDPDKNRLQKEVINIYIEIVRLTFTSENKDVLQISEYDFQKLRGQRDGYAIGFIMGRLGRFYKNHSSFPLSLNELRVDDKIEVLGISKISYAVGSDDFKLIFAGGDGILNSSDDRIYSKKDINK